MKINFITLIISIAIAGLIAFGVYAANNDETYRILITIGAGITVFITLGGLLAVSSPNGSTLNIKVVSVLFLIAFTLEHIIFSLAGVAMTPYIIITGILLLVYILICYSIFRALK